MIQLAVFLLPEQLEEANAFLKKQRPSGNVMFNTDRVFIFYEDGAFTPEHEIDDLRAMIISANKPIDRLTIPRGTK